MLTAPAHPRRRGYVLLLTLVLLALISASLVGLARASLSTTLAASQAQAELQRRWAVLSLQSTLLPEAETILARLETQTKSAQARCVANITLNNAEVTLTFADETAALPAGPLLAELGATQADIVLRTLLRGTGSTAELRLLPTAGKRAELLAPEQIFPRSAPPELQPLLHLISPFSPGAVNVRRAPRPVLLARLGTLLPPTDVAALQKQLAENPKLTLDQALSRLTLTDKVREALETRLTDSSATHSLWITVRTPGRELSRDYHRLAIRQEPREEEPEDPPPVVFDW